MMMETEIALARGGVFRLSGTPRVASLEAVAAQANLEAKSIDVTRAPDKQRFLSLMATALSLPDYFGENWDAFYDCLTDLAPPQHGRLWLICGMEGLARFDPDGFAAAISVFSDAADFWREAGKPMIVLIVIQHAELSPDLTELNLA